MGHMSVTYMRYACHKSYEGGWSKTRFSSRGCDRVSRIRGSGLKDVIGVVENEVQF